MEAERRIDDARLDLEEALRRNADATSEGGMPPVGLGAVEVLRGRLASARGEPAVRTTRLPAKRTAAGSPQRERSSGSSVPTMGTRGHVDSVERPASSTASMAHQAATAVDSSDPGELLIIDRVRSLRARFGLSDRECEVLALLTQGLRNREVSQELFVGQETVKSHLSSIYRKLGVGSRTEAMALVLHELAAD